MSERKWKSVELSPTPEPSIEFCPCQKIPDNLNPQDLADDDLKAFWYNVRVKLSESLLDDEFEQKLCPPTCCRPRHLACRYPRWHPLNVECVWTPQRRDLWRPCCACRMYRDLLRGTLEVDMDSVARRLYALDPSCAMLNRLFEQYCI